MKTFEEVMNSEWIKFYPYDADGPGVVIKGENNNEDNEDNEDFDDDEGNEVIFIFPQVWDEFQPIKLNEKDTIKLYNVLSYSKDMFNLLREKIDDDERIRELVDRILNDTNFPE